MRRLAVLISGSLAFWVLLVYPAKLRWGEAAVLFSTVALALCLAPAAGTLAWGLGAPGRSPEQRLMTVVGGMLLRMGAVLGGGLALSLSAPAFRQQSFWIWVLVFYLFTLALEMGLLFGARSAAGDP